MSDEIPSTPAPKTPDREPAQPAPAEAVASVPVTVKRRLQPRPTVIPTITPPPLLRPPAAPSGPPRERRDFFSDAMREVLSPFSRIIERKIQPILNAIEAIPDQAERLTKTNIGHVALDQLHTRINNILPGPSFASTLPRSDIARAPTRSLRPPGAMAPGEFESVCSRCGKCVDACPAEAIKLDPNGLIADGFPYIVAEEQPCVVSEDLACMKSCPTGALQLIDRLEINMGTAKVDHALCLRDRGENCTLCIDVCPVIDENSAFSALVISPITGKVIVHKNICIGCGLCEHRCPTEPRAITVIPYAPPIDPIIA